MRDLGATKLSKECDRCGEKRVEITASFHTTGNSHNVYATSFHCTACGQSWRETKYEKVIKEPVQCLDAENVAK